MTTDRVPAPQSTELVWDSGHAAMPASWTWLLPEGSGTDWTPARLLATAAGASLLTTLLEIADDAQLPILGYVAQQRPELDPATNELSNITISACISVPSREAATAARAAWKLAVTRAPILRALSCPVHAEQNIVVLSDRECSAA